VVENNNGIIVHTSGEVEMIAVVPSVGDNSAAIETKRADPQAVTVQSLDTVPPTRAHSSSLIIDVSQSYQMTDGERARLGLYRDDEDISSDDNEQEEDDVIDENEGQSTTSTATAARNAHAGYTQNQRRVVRDANMAANAIGILAGNSSNNRGMCTLGTTSNRNCL
jgi:hypothetical protein